MDKQNHLLHFQKAEHQVTKAKGQVHLLSSFHYASIAWCCWMVLQTSWSFLEKHRRHLFKDCLSRNDKNIYSTKKGFDSTNLVSRISQKCWCIHTWRSSKLKWRRLINFENISPEILLRCIPLRLYSCFYMPMQSKGKLSSAWIWMQISHNKWTRVGMILDKRNCYKLKLS